MPDDRTVHRVLLVLADRFDQKAAGAQGIAAREAWEAAARIAREEAQGLLGAASDAGPVSPGAGERTEALSGARERLGRLVREVWADWASEQDNPKPSWLMPWGQLDAGQREVDMRIGEAIAADERERIAQVVDAYECPCGSDIAQMIREQR